MGQPIWRRVVEGCINPRMWIGVTTPFWEVTLRCSLNLQQNLALHTASSPKFLIQWLKLLFSTKTSASPNLWHSMLQLTHILWGPACPPFTHPSVLNPQRDSQMPGTEGMHPHPTPHEAAKVRDKEMIPLGRILANFSCKEACSI